MKLYFQIKSDDSPRAGEWLTIRAERESEGEGLQSVWFVLFRSEIEALFRGEAYSFVDGFHKLEVFDDDWLFYNQELPTAESGVMRCPFWRIRMPRTFMRAVYRLARKTWRLMRVARDAGVPVYDRVTEVRLDVDSACYARGPTLRTRQGARRRSYGRADRSLPHAYA